LVPAKRDCRAEGEENFSGWSKIILVLKNRRAGLGNVNNAGYSYNLGGQYLSEHGQSRPVDKFWRFW